MHVAKQHIYDPKIPYFQHDVRNHRNSDNGQQYGVCSFLDDGDVIISRQTKDVMNLGHGRHSQLSSLRPSFIVPPFSPCLIFHSCSWTQRAWEGSQQQTFSPPLMLGSQSHISGLYSDLNLHLKLRKGHQSPVILCCLNLALLMEIKGKLPKYRLVF